MGLFGKKSKFEPLKAGVYHTAWQKEGKSYRLHLRVDNDLSGVMIINAAKVLHLNKTAAEYARLLIEGANEKDIVGYIKSQYRVNKSRIAGDYRKIKETVETLAEREDICPVSFLGLERIEPLKKELSAPYRIDFAMTYECNNRCLHCYVEEGRKRVSMSLDRWKEAIKKCWEIGVPHICFTGGEPTVYEHLPELVETAEDIGIVTGVLTNGRRLSDENYISRLIGAGVDHFQITLESHNEEIHDKMVGVCGAFKETVKGIENAVKAGVYTLTNTTLTRLNVEGIEETVKFIADKGIKVFAMNGLIYSGKAPESGLGIPEDKLEEIINRIMSAAEGAGMKFIWYTPTRYCQFDPIALGLGIKQCSAARYNMCVEPDGMLIPCQSYYEPLGNFLDEKWEKLWNAPLCVSLRKRDWVSDECRSCARFSECGGGCPIYAKVNKIFCMDATSAAAV